MQNSKWLTNNKRIAIAGAAVVTLCAVAYGVKSYMDHHKHDTQPASVGR